MTGTPGAVSGSPMAVSGVPEALSRTPRALSRTPTAVSAAPDAGQGTAELAVLLPVLLILIFTVVQVGVVVRDHASVHHAARAAARRAAVTPDEASARAGAVDAAGGLRADRLQVELDGGRQSGDVLTVSVSYPSPTEVPLVGRFVGDVELSATASVRVE